MNKKGFAVSGIIYSILVLFLILILCVLSLLGSRKLMLDKLKNDVLAKLDGDEEIINVYRDTSGANVPFLMNNMIPVKYDGENWIYADVTRPWYDYTKKEWANAVVLNDNVVKGIGDIIEEDDIALWYVWIPRYKYTIFNGNNGSVSEQNINIMFENGTETTGTVRCEDAINETDESGNLISEKCTDVVNGNIIDGRSTYTHPAFTFGDREVTGIWIGKFETSTTDQECNTNNDSDSCNNILTATIKPNVNSWRNASISNYFYSTKNISSTYNINGNSHMIKNMEWGAVAYFKQSYYGLSTTDIGINNNSDYITGCGAVSGSEESTTCNAYNTILGMTASTTGNIYGVYDMSGGTYEYAMGNMVTDSGEFFVNNSGFTSNVSSKYYDSYTFGNSKTLHSRGKLGDATKEILKTFGNAEGGWYDDYSHFPSSSSSAAWFARGGYPDFVLGSGTFNFDSSSGSYESHIGTRAVLVPYESQTYAVGDLLKIQVGDGITYNFYVLQDNGDEVTVIMDRNLGGNVALSSSGTTPTLANTYLNDQTLEWNYVIDKRLPRIEDIMKQVEWYQTLTDRSNWKEEYWDYVVNSIDFPTCSTEKECREAFENLGASEILLPNWLNINLYTSGDDTLDVNEKYKRGYWTSSPVVDENGELNGSTYAVTYSGIVYPTTPTLAANNGVRPVITIDKSHVITKLKQPSYVDDGQQEYYYAYTNGSKDGFVFDVSGTITDYTGSLTELTIPNTLTMSQPYYVDFKEEACSMILNFMKSYNTGMDANEYLQLEAYEKMYCMDILLSLDYEGVYELYSQGLADVYPGYIKYSNITFNEDVCIELMTEMSVITESTRIEIEQECSMMKESFEAGEEVDSEMIYMLDHYGVIDVEKEIVEHIGDLDVQIKNIGSSAFSGNSLTSVIISEGIETIEERAFYNNLLTSITIPDTVTYIGGGAFTKNNLSEDLAYIFARDADGFIDNSILISYGGTLTDVTIPSTVTSIDDYAFYNLTTITNVNFPEGLREIGEYAFYDNAIIVPNLPNSLTRIGNYAFYSNGITGTLDLSSLTNLTYLSGFNSNTISGLVLPNSLIEFGDSAFSNNSLTSLSIPNSIKVIGDSAFYNNTTLSSVVIPNGTEKIGQQAFYENALTEITLPTSLTYIGDSAFYSNGLSGTLDLSSLTNLEYLSGFDDNTLTEVILPNNIKIIGTSAFANNTLSTLTLPTSITFIGESAFSGVGLTEVLDLSSLTNLTYLSGFDNNTITSIIIPSSVKEIGMAAFSTNTITSLTLPDSITSIGAAAFMSNGMTSLTLPSNLKVIGMGAFSENKIPSLVIPDGVTYIGGQSFSGNEATSIKLPKNLEKVGTGAFIMNPATDLVLPDGLKEINPMAFALGCNVTELVIPDSVELIGMMSFSFSTVGNLTVSKNTDIIGYQAFAYSTVNSVIIPEGVKEIQEQAFYSTDDLTSVVIPSTLTTIGIEAFYQSALTTLDLSNATSLETISDSAFYKAPITSLDFSNASSLTAIGSSAFRYAAITTLDLSGATSLTTLNSYAFGNNTSLTTVTIPNSVTSIATNTFYSDTAITSITIDKASGSLLNSPWGATNATITYLR